MPGRKFTAGTGYRYGFNGKENDDETSTQDYGFRIYNPSLGRFLSIDPITKDYPWYTPYQFAGNKPIAFIDLDGLEEAKFDAQWRNDYKTAKELYPDDPAKRQAYQLSAKKDRAIGAGIGAAIVSIPFIAEYFPLLARMGYVGAGVGAGISIAKGDNAYEVVKSAFSGFYGGAALGVGGSATSLLGLAGKGAISGLVGEATNQVFDNAFGNADGADLGKLVKSGAVGAIANTFSSKLVDVVYAKVNQLIAKQLAQTENAAYRKAIQKAIQAETPGLGNKELKKAVDSRIGQIQGLIRKEGDQLKAGLQQAIEKGTSVLEDKSK